MSGVSSSDQGFINRLTGIILANLENEHFAVDELAHASGMSRAAIYHRLLAVSGKSTTQFIREVRLQRAMEMLQQEDITASEVAYKVGFGSPAYFNTTFHEYFGYPPGEVLKNGQKELEEINNSTADEPAVIELEPGPESKKKSGWNILVQQVYIYSGICLMIVIGLIWLMNSSIIKSSNTIGYKQLKSSEKTISVLPFKNISGEAGNQYFADGVTENILNNLVQINGLKVVAAGTLIGRTEDPLDVQKIAKKLGVNFLLTGSVQKNGDRVRVIVQLIDTKNDQHIWSHKYDRQFSDIFLIQSDIVRQVADQLQAVLSSEEKEKIYKISTKNTEAYKLYLMGRFFWNKRTGDKTDEGLKKSMDYFNKAIEFDPDYALAWSGLADAYNFLTGGWCKPWQKQDEKAKAKQYALRALELDKFFAEALTYLGFILIYLECMWEEAIKELTLAIKLNPNYSFAHQIYAQLLNITGDYKKAGEEINLALELDPLNSTMHRISGDLYYNEGNFEKSLKEFQEAQAIEKNYTTAYWGSFYACYRLGNGDKALDELRNILLRDTLTSKYVDVADKIYTKSGLDGLIAWMIEIFPDKIDLYAIAGKKEKALTLIEGKLKNDSGDELVQLINRLNYASLRSEPGFKAVIEKLGLTEYYLKRLNDPGYIGN